MLNLQRWGKMVLTPTIIKYCLIIALSIAFLLIFFLQIAMSDQKLDNRELLNIRWAFDDPNPKARKEVSMFACSLEPACRGRTKRAVVTLVTLTKIVAGVSLYPKQDFYLSENNTHFIFHITKVRGDIALMKICGDNRPSEQIFTEMMHLGSPEKWPWEIHGHFSTRDLL